MRLLLLFLAGGCLGDKFAEELLLTPAPSGHLAAYFKFTTVQAGDPRQATDWQHYHLFPRPLGELLAAYSVQELKVSLTQGLWRPALLGYPVEAAPPGALVIARFLPTVGEVDTAWAGLTAALAGLLCASLNKLELEAVSPQFSFQPTGAAGPNLTNDPAYLRVASLPGENVCTENLTPWKKLLPCKGRRGLATLLGGGSIQRQSSYQSLSLSIRPVCGDPDCTALHTQLSQSLTAVFDPAVYNGRADNTDWSVAQLFGIGLGPACPVADTSAVYVDLTTDSGLELTPAPDRLLTTGAGDNTRQYAVIDTASSSQDGRIRNLSGKHNRPHRPGVVPAPVLTVSRHLTGAGQERGGLAATLRNTGREPLTVVYLDTLPWYLRLYLHTLLVTTADGQTLTPARTHYSPGRDRKRPYHLELVLSLPPRSTTTITIQFEHSLLRWVEYPPDANHGFYVGAATVTARIPDNRNATLLAPEDSTLSYAIWGNPHTVNTVLNLYTEILLVSLPTPDFSMPYNVICLACTVAALAFGPIHNITTKSLVLVQPGEEEKGLLGKVLDKLLSLFRKRKKVDEKVEAEEEADAEEESSGEEGEKETEAVDQ